MARIKLRSADEPAIKSDKPSGEKKYSRYGSTRKVPEWILKQVLGDEKSPVSNRAKGGRKEVLKRSMLKQGRKDPGMKNPRGGRNLSQDIRQQLEGGPGDSPQEGPQTQTQRDVIARIMGNEGKKKYDKAELLKKIESDEAEKKAAKDKKSNKGKPAMYKSRSEREEDDIEEE